jgi:hypothetical protein
MSTETTKPDKPVVPVTILKPIATTRFTAESIAQFEAYGAKTGQHWYGMPKAAPMSIDLPRGALVIEMNNSENKIHGVGLILKDGCEKRKPIYRTWNWCRHTARRDAWRSAAEMKEELGEECLALLERMLFKSRQNQKRWTGITGWTCPDERLKERLLAVRLALRREHDARVIAAVEGEEDLDTDDDTAE